MSNVLCDGNESELSHCRFDGWASGDCEASEAAGVICKSDEIAIAQETDAERKPKKNVKAKINRKLKMELRLTGGRDSNEGQVEVSA